MYHISHDKRSERSAETIYEGLLRCLEEKPFDRITVSDLQRASGVARTTFYRCFDDVSDVLTWRCDACFAEVLGQCGPEGFADELGLVRRYFEYWMRHSDILELLVRIDRQDIIYACHMRAADALQERYGSVPGLPDGEGDYFMALRTGLTISILTTWLRRGRTESPDEVADIVKGQVAMIARGSGA
ncbi:MAG: TetR/AcrR family transcriptional regulator [Atopobiaceae bacterium]|jgi:AcrR family transcriptional regulator|nr:TetR/AcrR family transcriptional regulator [Atopobiaceae bacterium]